VKRYKTDYPGVFYRKADRIGKKGTERVFYIVFKKDGKAYEEKVGRQYADDMTPAKANNIRADRIEGRRPSRKDLREGLKAAKLSEAKSIDWLWRKFKEDKDLKGIAQDESRYNLYLFPHLGGKEPQEIEDEDIKKVKKALKDKSPQHLKLTLALLRRIVNHGQKKHNTPPMQITLEMPKVNNVVIEDLNRKQIARLVRSINDDPCPEVAAVMGMALFSGMRRGEILKLRWEDIDYERGFIAIRDPKGGKDATIPLNDAVRRILKKVPQGESPLVFPGRDGNVRSDIRRTANRIKKAAGLPEDFRPMHGLRHVFASNLASSGQVDLYTLQKLLTHKDPKTTQRYAHLRDDALRRASNLAGQIMHDVGSKERRGKR